MTAVMFRSDRINATVLAERIGTGAKWVAVVTSDEVQDAPDVFGPFATEREASDRLRQYREDSCASEEELSDSGIFLWTIELR